jgi:hypothetical protein
MKKERTFPKAYLRVVPLEVSEPSIDGKSSCVSARERERERVCDGGFVGRAWRRLRNGEFDL